MNAYSKDLRLKALAAVDRGTPRREVVGIFGVSPAALKRWLKRRREGADYLTPKPSPGTQKNGDGSTRPNATTNSSNASTP